MGRVGSMLQAGRAFGVRDGMLRLEYELRRGSGLMSWKMRSVHGWDSWSIHRICPKATAEQILASRRDKTRHFLFSNIHSLRPTIEHIVVPEGKKSILAEAENILNGDLPFFGQLSYACGFPPRWFQNPVTGQGVSPHTPWTQMRFASPTHGDLKFILEPSRFLFIYTLVRAYALSGDQRFAEGFWRAIEDWARCNAPMAGPLWICGQECSLRILAWSFGLHAFINSPATTNERVELLVSMIAAHAWRTAQTLGYARSQRSNHLISEAVGLWTAGTLYPELSDAQIWRNLGAQLLHEAVQDQITPDGVSQQHSFNYQRMILHLLFWTLRLAEIHDDTSLHPGIRSRAEAAFSFIRAWIDPVTGHAPNYGSNDGSLIFPLSVSPYRDFRPLVQLGAAILHRHPLPSGPWDEAALWFGVQRVFPKNNHPAPASSLDTGYFRLGDRNSWALIRAGRYTRRPFQADQLHIDLWWHGINIARDAGTYLYNGPSPWNNALAGTAVHNTITIDHRDQMRKAGRFLWLDWAQAQGRFEHSLHLPDEKSSDAPDIFIGQHDGYRRIGVTHRRTVRWLGDAGWAIVDDIVGSGEHNVRLHWLAPDLPHSFSESPFQIDFTAGEPRIHWNIFCSSPATSSVVRAGQNEDFGRNLTAGDGCADPQLLGWESPTYGELVPAISLVQETCSHLPMRFVTAILSGKHCRLLQRNQELLILKNDSHANVEDEFEICRISLSPETTAAKAEPNAVNEPRA